MKFLLGFVFVFCCYIDLFGFVLFFDKLFKKQGCKDSQNSKSSRKGLIASVEKILTKAQAQK